MSQQLRDSRGHSLASGAASGALGAGVRPESHSDPRQAAARAHSPAVETFGHEPVAIWGDHFCARCREHGIDRDGEPWWYPTQWPCTSAVVLGLAPRPTTDRSSTR